MKFFLKSFLAGLLLFATLLFVAPLPSGYLDPPQAYRFYDINGELLTTIISEDGFFRMHVSLDDISPLFLQTLLLQEDQYFYKHPGVNPLAIIRALGSNFNQGRIVSGGSTITMQLARMLERRPRTLWAKTIETFRAIQLELRFSKEDILSYYLAVAPYGGNVEGIQAASYAYYDKPASTLSAGEIALLVALPKSPNKYRPDRHPEVARSLRDVNLQRMLAADLIDQSQYRRALLEEIPRNKYPVRNLIPHTSWHYRFADPKRYEWHTTIDVNIQLRVQNLLRSYISMFDTYDITNASAVVIDNHTQEVRAVVGSLDYFSRDALGANDGCRSPRSPGSTLKPFLYGLGFQEGLISQRTILYDIPINYAGYSPQNYSREFLGPVTAHEALTESLNVVAVRLSRELGIEKLFNLLKDGGLSHLDKPSSYYGLPLVLGGVEASLIDLVNLYSSLAHGGMYKQNRLLTDEVNGESTQLLSREAAWLVTHILTDVERPDFPSSWEFSRNRPTIAWKTGTSYGHQDAWSIGVTPEYTVGVWMGNFDATPSKGLVGSEAAAPLLFDLFQAIQPQLSGQWFSKPDKVKKRKVCAVSGLMPSRYCQTFGEEFYIEGLSGPAYSGKCTIEQEIAVDQRSNKQADITTPALHRERRVYNIWPSEMASHLARHGVPVKNTPPYDIGNMTGQKYYSPEILSPVANTIYYKRLDKLKQEQHGIKLAGAATNRIKKVFWFLNDELIAQGSPEDEFIVNPPPGNYIVKLMDDVGSNKEVELVIKDYRELLDNDVH